MSEYFWWAVTSPLWIGPALLTVIWAVVLVVAMVVAVIGGIILAVEYIKDLVMK